MLSSLEESVIVFNAVQPKQADFTIAFTLFGMDKVSIELHLRKQLFMVSTPSTTL